MRDRRVIIAVGAALSILAGCGIAWYRNYQFEQDKIAQLTKILTVYDKLKKDPDIIDNLLIGIKIEEGSCKNGNSIACVAYERNKLKLKQDFDAEWYPELTTEKWLEEAGKKVQAIAHE